MNRLLPTLKRPLAKLCRMPHSKGYGVHSPFAFDLITFVINQRTPYYKYRELRAEEHRLAPTKGREWRSEPLRVKRLLFRLANEVQPEVMVDFGTPAASSLYLKGGCQRADYTAATCLSELFLEAGAPIDFLYLHDYRQPELLRQVFDLCVPRTRTRSLFVVEGIRYSSVMHRLWKRMQEDPHTGVSFDLYDLGLIFFDHEIDKQHYIINF